MKTSDQIVFKLYFIEKSPIAKDFIIKLRSFLDENLKAGYSLEAIDILTYPDKVAEDNIMASPTLIKEKPSPSKRIVGGIKWEHLIEDFNLSEKK